MNKEAPYRERAERLKQPIQKVNETMEVDDFLPPRRQLHQRKKKKIKWKPKYPVIRLLVFVFVLLPVIIFSVISYLEGRNVQPAGKKPGSSVGYETIHLEKSNEERPQTSNHTNK